MIDFDTVCTLKNDYPANFKPELLSSWLARLNGTIAVVWLASGLISLIFFPHQQSLSLLAKVGIPAGGQIIVFYSLIIMDIGLGIATLLKWQLIPLLSWQLAIVIIYTLVVGICLPEFVIHPFGPVLKNLPFLMVIAIYRDLLGANS